MLEKKDLIPAPAPAPLQKAPYLEAFTPNVESDPEHPPLVEYWRILRRHKGTLVLISFAGLLMAVLVTLPQTPIYQARTTLEVQDLNQDFMNLRQVNPMNETGQSYNALTDIQTQIKILQSNTVAEASVAKLNLAYPKPPSPPARIAAWRKTLNLPEHVQVATVEAQAAAALKNLKVRAAGQTRIVELLYDSTDPKVAADFLNILTNEYIDQNMQARWQMTQRTGEWLTRQLDDMRVKLERSEDALQAYARQAGLLFTNEKQNVSDEKLRQVQAELGKATADRVQRQARFEMARTSPPEALADVLNDQSLRAYQTKLTDLRREEAEMSSTYKPEYSKVKRIQAQIAPLEAALVRERTAILQRIKNDYDEAMARERLLTTDYASQSRQVTQEAERSIQYNILKREVDSNRQLYEAMLQRVKESGIASALRASNVRIVDPARPPRLPYKPQMVLNSALGILAGVFVGIAFVVMRERANRALQEPGDAQYFLNVPELGIIPAAEAGKRRHYYLGRKKDDETGKSVVTLRKEHEVANTIELVTWQQKPSMAAEAFRLVLTSILFSGQNGNRPKVLVMTSPSPREGKTTVTSNLAIAMAGVHKKTLLIDADLRRPRQDAIFEVPNDRGLSDLLIGTNLADEGAAGMIRETKIPGLYVLPSGPTSAVAANLLFSKAMPELLSQLRQEFDMVLIDTPPMLQMPDARVLGRMADAVILVLRAGSTTRDAAIAARQRFAEDQTNLLGTILNDWNPKSSPGGYYGYYSGNYGGNSRYYQEAGSRGVSV